MIVFVHILSLEGVKISANRLRRELSSASMLWSNPGGIMFREGVNDCECKKRISETNLTSSTE